MLAARAQIGQGKESRGLSNSWRLAEILNAAVWMTFFRRARRLPLRALAAKSSLQTAFYRAAGFLFLPIFCSAACCSGVVRYGSRSDGSLGIFPWWASVYAFNAGAREMASDGNP